ncbi:MAG: membrane protein insertase YidC [Aerococcus sp.]|nr:membrane protein insertase YidC [Aerococcus sp.]
MSRENLSKRFQTMGMLATLAFFLTGCVNRNNPDSLMFKIFVTPINWLIEHFATFLNGNYGFALILVVAIVRLVLTPLMLGSQKASIKQQVVMEAYKPQFDDFKRRMQEANGNQQLQIQVQQEQMQFMSQAGVNPMDSMKSGCLPLLIQLPILSGLYSAVYTNQNISNFVFFGIRLGEKSLMLGVVIMVVYLLQSWMMVQSVPEEQRKAMMGTAFTMPLMALMFMFTSPAGLMLYFLTSAVWSVFQMLWTNEIYRPRLKKQIEADLKEHPIHVNPINTGNRPRRDVTDSAKNQTTTPRSLNNRNRNRGKQQRRK